MAVGIWTDPRTWVDGETPTGAMFNTQIRDNLNYLKGSPVFDGNVTVQDLTVRDVTARNLTATQNVTANAHLAAGGNLTVGHNATLGAAPGDVIDVKGTVVNAPLKTYTETRINPVIAGGVLVLDCSLGTYFRVMVSSSAAVQIVNPPANGRALGITIICVAGGGTLTWPGAVLWPSGAAPTLTLTGGKRDVITLVTEDGGGSWFGVIVGQNY